ncbi:MAG: alpha-ketoacid dehydrogenase subunit beta [Candidatus Diapherotrites archaeon]|nr:alpha-ketoacid dehydrogenase subunit beta [Candidatus Diapherotrites archaeon]
MPNNLTIVEAINQAMMQEMEKDKMVLLLGEDVGVDGGVFRASQGLLQKFGPERVIDTPLAESGIVGVSIGLALNGFKPIAEIQFSGFIYPALDQLISHAGRYRNRTRGQRTVPMVVRAPCSGGIKAPEHHSESVEAFFAHTPGLKTVMPSNPVDAKGLLISAIRDPDPVVFLEPTKLYRSIRQEVPKEEYVVPLEKASVMQEGQDVTVIAWGTMVKAALETAQALSEKYSVEVIDLRTIYPMDIDTIVGSVQKTGRCVIVHEAPRTCGFGAEISSLLNEHDLLSLKAPVERVTGFDTVMPLAKSEQYYIPSIQRVSAAVKKAMEF